MTIQAAKPTEWTVPRQPPLLTAFKLTGVVTASALFIALVVRTGAALAAAPGAWPVVPALVLGYLVADMLSGTAHWFCDTFFDESTPLIGRTVIHPFRDHHVHQDRIVQYRFLEQDTTNFFIMLPFLATAHWQGAPQAGSVPALVWCGCLLGLATGSFGTNLFHKWAHETDPPAIARALQRTGLILNPERHQVHHDDHGRGFCVTSGWMNPFLDAIRFFRRVERSVRFFQR